MPNAIEILERLIVEYPKNPTTGELVELIDRDFQADDYVSRFVPENVCMCLLGAAGYSAGLPLAKIDYNVLDDENGIEEALNFLAQVIDPERYAQIVANTEEGEKVRGYRVYGLIYGFNDIALVPTQETKSLRHSQKRYTEESIGLVVEKIKAALALAQAAAEKG